MTNKVQTAFYFEGAGQQAASLSDAITTVLDSINHNRTSDEVAKTALNVLLKSFENSDVYNNISGCSATFQAAKEDEIRPDEFDDSEVYNEEDEEYN